MHLYVGNLALAVTEADLRLIFEGAGEIVFTQLGAAAPGARRYAYVEMSSTSQAQIAVDALHGRYLKGTALVVEAVAERARVGAAPHATPRRVTPLALTNRRTRAAALGLYLVKNNPR